MLSVRLFGLVLYITLAFQTKLDSLNACLLMPLVDVGQKIRCCGSPDPQLFYIEILTLLVSDQQEQGVLAPLPNKWVPHP